MDSSLDREPREREVQRDVEVKVLLIGNRGVGKSSLARRFVCSQYRSKHIPTQGFDFYQHTITLPGSRSILFSIWDVSNDSADQGTNSRGEGDPLHGISLFKNFFAEGVNYVFFLYDITNIESYKSLEAHWINYIHAAQEMRTFNTATSMKWTVIGNKLDLGHQRMVTSEQHLSLVKKMEATGYLTSCKTNDNVSTIFVNLAASLTSFNMKKYGDEVRNAEVVRAVVIDSKHDDSHRASSAGMSGQPFSDPVAGDGEEDTSNEGACVIS